MLQVSVLDVHTDYSSPRKPVAVVVADGHDEVNALADLLNGRTAVTNDILDAGMLLDLLKGAPDAGAGAHRILADAGCPDVMEKIRAHLDGERPALTDFGRLVHDWAGQVIRDREALAPELPPLSDDQRLWATVAMTWAVMALGVPGPVTRMIVETTQAMRDQAAVESQHRRTLVRAA